MTDLEKTVNIMINYSDVENSVSMCEPSIFKRKNSINSTIVKSTCMKDKDNNTICDQV